MQRHHEARTLLRKVTWNITREVAAQSIFASKGIVARKGMVARKGVVASHCGNA